MTQQLLRRADRDRPAVIAHRGHSAVAPENTLIAVAEARHAGADWIEVDVRISADGVPMVIHDATVDRTTAGTGRVAALTGDELAALDAGSWFGPTFAGEPVPTFAQLVADLAERGGRLLLELKWPHGRDEVARVLDLIRGCGLADRVVLQSFRPAILAEVAGLAPELPRALLTTELHDDPVTLCRDLGLIGYHPSAEDLLTRPELVAQLHAIDVATLVWTPNEERLWDELDAIGVDGLITDRAGDMVKWSRDRG